MREIVYRRYRRLLDEGAELPDLIIVDGGKGQLSSAYGVLCELGLAGQVPVVGLAKRIEEIFYPGDPMPYYLSRTGEPLKVVCHIRDEAHRFGITFHRQKRSKAFIHSELEQIPGIGNQDDSGPSAPVPHGGRRAPRLGGGARCGRRRRRARKIRAWFDDPSSAENPFAENPSADPTENPDESPAENPDANLAENPAANSAQNPF